MRLFSLLAVRVNDNRIKDTGFLERSGIVACALHIVGARLFFLFSKVARSRTVCFLFFQTCYIRYDYKKPTGEDDLKMLSFSENFRQPLKPFTQH